MIAARSLDNVLRADGDERREHEIKGINASEKDGNAKARRERARGEKEAERALITQCFHIREEKLEQCGGRNGEERISRFDVEFEKKYAHQYEYDLGDNKQREWILRNSPNRTDSA